MAIIINGTQVDPEHATVSIFDRGFQYGDGLFETIAVVRGQPVYWEEHIRRMTTGARVLGIPMPAPEIWERDAMFAIDGTDRAVLKLTLTRGVGGRGYSRPFPQLPTRLAYTAPWPQYPQDYWERGVDVVTCRTAQLGGDTFATVKSLNRLNQVLARAELPDSASEGLLLDRSGNVREGTFTNVVWIHKGRAYTPRLTDVGIAGIMRGAILAHLSEQGISCEAVDVPPGVLLDSDECFVCNSLVGAWPVRSLDGRPLRESPGPVTRATLSWIYELGLGPVTENASEIR
jgi:4-amino-4-deoxychorismate lyase